MGSIEQNRKTWDETFDWSGGGDEWSRGWGGTPAMWYGMLLPRVHTWLPAKTVLEIAPGFGRWTAYLKDLASRLIIVDLAPKCIAACRQRFVESDHIEYFVNDGRSLPMVASESVDFVFSFDSLVHADADAISGYVRALGRVLTADGVAFIHHSDLGGFPAGGIRLAEIIAARVPFLSHTSPLLHWRSRDVSAQLVERLAADAGLLCRSQELFQWARGPYLTDCVSVLTRRGSRWARQNIVVKRRDFRRMAAANAALARLY
jgi:SAM-dependent methyltransferase